MKKLATLALAFGVVVAAAGCGSAAKDAIDGGLKKSACSAIPKVQSKLTNVQDLKEEDLKKVQTAAKTASSAISTLESKLPEGAAKKVADATVKFNDSVENAKSGTAGSQEEVQKAADELNTELDTVSKDLKC